MAFSTGSQWSLNGVPIGYLRIVHGIMFLGHKEHDDIMDSEARGWVEDAWQRHVDRQVGDLLPLCPVESRNSLARLSCDNIKLL